MIFLIIFSILLFLELTIFILVKKLKKNFKWIITSEDELPNFEDEKLENFFKKNYSSELGWDRKAGSKGIEKNNENISNFEISKNGFRKSNYNFKNSKIATFGDSYAFCRYVSDDETWQYYLENELKTHVRNYGVGNYGLDQAFLKFDQTELEKENETIIFAVVPETISRIHSYWKHYLEFGNIFSFKPKFTLNETNEISKTNNFLLNQMNKKSIFENIDLVKKNDYFYTKKFRKRMFKFPFTLSLLKYPKLNIQVFYFLMIDLFLRTISKNYSNKKFYNEAIKKIIIQNIIDANYYYSLKETSLLLEKIIMQYSKKIAKLGKKMILLIIPQKYDLSELKQKNYKIFFESLSKKINVLDLTSSFENSENINSLYINDNYAGHLSKIGNQLVCREILLYMKDKKI